MIVRASKNKIILVKSLSLSRFYTHSPSHWLCSFCFAYLLVVVACPFAWTFVSGVTSSLSPHHRSFQQFYVLSFNWHLESAINSVKHLLNNRQSTRMRGQQCYSNLNCMMCAAVVFFLQSKFNKWPSQHSCRLTKQTNTLDLMITCRCVAAFVCWIIFALTNDEIKIENSIGMFRKINVISSISINI